MQVGRAIVVDLKPIYAYTVIMISVIIADDHPLIHSGLKSLLSLPGDIDILSVATTGKDAIDLTLQFEPDVLILDVNLPDMNGDEVARQIRKSNQKTAILILTIQDDPTTVFRLLESGVTGYVLKDEAGSTLLNAVRITAQGETWLSPRIAKEVVKRALRPQITDQIPKRSNEPSPTLSVRELDILRLIALGMDNDSIARELQLTTRTIQNHVSIIYVKLGVSTRTAAVLLAIRNKWIDF